MADRGATFAAVPCRSCCASHGPPEYYDTAFDYPRSVGMPVLDQRTPMKEKAMDSL